MNPPKGVAESNREKFPDKYLVPHRLLTVTIMRLNSQPMDRPMNSPPTLSTNKDVPPKNSIVCVNVMINGGTINHTLQWYEAAK